MFVIYNNTSKEVYSVGDKDDTVIPEGYSLVEVEGQIGTYKFPSHPCNCYFKDSTFVVNQNKLDEIENIKIANAKEALIQEKIREMAVAELKAEGKI
jgi:hypothetical protein